MKLEALEKSTFKKHILYSAIDGFVVGTLALNEFVFVRTMHGSGVGLSFLFQFSVIVLLISVFINEYLKRYRDKRQILIKITFFTRLPMFIFLFFPHDFNLVFNSNFYHLIFLAIFLVFFMSGPVVLPIINLFLKHNYKDENFGKLYSYSETVKKIFTIISTLLFGILLDYNKDSYIYVYPILGTLSIISVLILNKIDVNKMNFTPVRTGLYQSVKKTFKITVKILKTDKSYRDFELGFMFYGIAFMMTAVIYVLFFENILKLNYVSVAFYKNFHNILAILLLPFFGKLLDRIDPRKFGIITFFFLFANIFFVMMTQYFSLYVEIFGIKIYYSMLIAYIFYGFFSASMALLWFIGSAYFTDKQNVDTYQATHLTLTGVRGVIAPILGVLILNFSNYTIIFIITLISVLISILILWSSLRKEKTNSK